MAGLELSILVGLAVAIVAAVTIWVGSGRIGPAARGALGAIAGVLGALVVLTEVADLIPDAVEVWLIPVWAGSVTAALVVLTIRSLAD